MGEWEGGEAGDTWLPWQPELAGWRSARGGLAVARRAVKSSALACPLLLPTATPSRGLRRPWHGKRIMGRRTNGCHWHKEGGSTPPINKDQKSICCYFHETWTLETQREEETLFCLLLLRRRWNAEIWLWGVEIMWDITLEDRHYTGTVRSSLRNTQCYARTHTHTPVHGVTWGSGGIFPLNTTRTHNTAKDNSNSPSNRLTSTNNI